MIRINLLPHRELARAARRRQFNILLGIAAATGVLVVVLGHSVISARQSNQEARNAYLEQEIAKLDGQIGEIKKIREQTQALRELADIAKVNITKIDSKPLPPGAAIHECGTARMGNSPANSVVDSNNQCWDARGLYVTDASCFPSQGAQNPTLTILALTARACAKALENRKRLS